MKIVERGESPRKKQNTMVNVLAGTAHDYFGSLILSSACQRESHQSECIQTPLPGGFYHGSYSDIFIHFRCLRAKATKFGSNSCKVVKIP